MRRLYVPASEAELLLIANLLEREGVRHFIQNDNVGTLYGAFSGGAMRKAVFVAEGDAARAGKLIEAAVLRPPAVSGTAIPGAVGTGGREARKQRHAVGRLLMLILTAFFLVPFVLMVLRALKGLLGL